MGINPNFNNKDLNKLQQQITNDLFQKTIKAFQYIGEMLVIHAKEKVGFTDKTGNLRSSIGYVLFVNGVVYSSGYSGNSEGQAHGKALAADLLATIPKQPVVLICTAGMNYALNVEAKGYNVLTATENEAKNIAKSVFNQLLKR